MILILKNFKCFQNAKFIFKSNDNTLITAPSGIGKSTIFEAIKFVLWGNRDSDIITFGRKKCEVSLEYKGYIIKRTKNPNNLSIITKQGGTVEYPEEFLEKHFKKYPQNFVEFTSTKQMQILESISSENNNISGLKDSIKSTIKDGNIKIQYIKNNIKSLKSSLDKIGKPENIEKPIFKSDYEIKDYHNELLELKKQYSKLEVDLELTKIYKKESLKYENEMIALNITNNDLKKYEELKIKFLNTKITNEKIKNIKSKILKFTITDDLEEINKNIYNLRTEQSKENYILEEIENCRSKCKKDYKNIKDIDKFLKQFKNDKILNSLKCPSCNIDLELKNKEGENYLEIIKHCEDYDKLIKISELQKKLTNINYKEKIINLETRSKQLLEIHNLKQELKNLENISSKTSEEGDISIIISNIEKFQELVKNLERVKLNIKNINLCQHENLEVISLKIFETEEKIQNIRMYEVNLKLWEQNEKNKNIIKDIKIDIDQNEIQLLNNLKFIENLERIKRFIEQSQSLSMSSLIKYINKIAQMFCNRFFDNNLILNIEEFKQIQSTKVIKPQIEININYKGNKMKVNNLSSGEYARVSLAIDLAIFQIINSDTPLLLDEVTSNLDSDLSTEIINYVNEIFSQKTLLIIAHQAVEGIFNNVFSEELLTSSKY